MKPFIFIHINKTGGTSLWHLLGEQPTHRTAADLHSEIGPKEWNELTVFTIVRNPFDRAVSLYEYRRSRNAQNILEDNLSFLEFLNRALVRKIPPYYNRAMMLSPQYKWLVDKRDRLLVNNIFSYENYEESIRQILQLIGRSRDEADRLNHVKGTNHEPYPVYYQGTEGERAKQIVLTEWEEDFIRFNYPTEI